MKPLPLLYLLMAVLLKSILEDGVHFLTVHI